MVGIILFAIFIILPVLFLTADIFYFYPKWERDVDSIFKKWDETWDKFQKGEITEEEYYRIVGRNKRKK